MSFAITHRATGRGIIVEPIDQAAGYRERVYLALFIAEHWGRWGHLVVIRAQYDPFSDVWKVGDGRIPVETEASYSARELERLGFWYIERE